MSFQDQVALVLNASSILALMLAFMAQEEGLFALAVAIGVIAIMTSSVAIARKERRPQAAATKPAVPADELDPNTVLDLDARLEALERAQHDAVDAARWRALVESGQVTGPAASASRSGDSASRQSVAS